MLITHLKFKYRGLVATHALNLEFKWDESDEHDCKITVQV